MALLAAGAILVLRPMLPAVRPFRAGGLCLFGALTLGLAAGTLGLGPGGSAVHWDADVGAPARRRGRRGAVLGDLDARSAPSARTSWRVFLFLAAVLLLTGASVAGVVKATTDSVSTTTRDMRAAVQRRRATEELARAGGGEPRVSRGTPPPTGRATAGDPDGSTSRSRPGAEPEPRAGARA